MKSESLLRKRWNKFKTMKRGYYSFWILIFLYLISFAFPYIFNDKPLYIKYGETRYLLGGAQKFHQGDEFGLRGQQSEPNYRYLKVRYEEDKLVRKVFQTLLDDVNWPRSYTKQELQDALLKGQWYYLFNRDELDKHFPVPGPDKKPGDTPDYVPGTSLEPVFEDITMRVWADLFNEGEVDRLLSGDGEEHFLIRSWEELYTHPEIRESFKKTFWTRQIKLVEKNRVRQVNSFADLQATKEIAAEYIDLDWPKKVLISDLRTVKKPFTKDDFAKLFDQENLEHFYTTVDVDKSIVMPLYAFGPFNNLMSEMPEGVRPPTTPDRNNWMGTDTSGRDVLARLAWGFKLSLSYGIVITIITYIIGIFIGAMLGYFAGLLDILGQRVIEVLSAMPFLYMIMIVSNIIRPGFWVLVGISSLLGWIGMTYFIRGEFLREKNRDYVAAAIAQGEGTFSIMFRQILPNALTPVISFAPFAIIGGIGALTGLDFLGFGLQPPTPSWGELMSQGLKDIERNWTLMLAPSSALFCTLLMITFIGEAVREAFDPKVFSRLR